MKASRGSNTSYSGGAEGLEPSFSSGMMILTTHLGCRVNFADGWILPISRPHHKLDSEMYVINSGFKSKVREFALSVFILSVFAL